ncbi:cytochrome P450 [Physcia stellaris]|nr:cytochrome P450 [Physcia stellaris]
MGTVGTFFQVWHVFKGRMSYTLAELHRKHGAFVRISYNEVSVCHPDALQILAAPIWKGHFYNLMAVPNSNYNNVMSERDPKKHNVMHSNVASAYTLSNALKNEPVIDEVIELMEQRLIDMSQQSQQIELGQWLHLWTFDLLGEIMFFSRFGFLDQSKDVGGSIGNNFYLSLYLTSMVYMQRLHSLLLARKAHTEARVDMVEHWMIQHEKWPEIFLENDLSSTVILTLGAGGGTMGSASEAFFYYLLKEDQKYLRRLQKKTDDAKTSQVLSYLEAQQLPYLQAVTVLSVNPWLMHRNQACFGTDAAIYNPERWLGDPVTVKKMEKYSIPYGLSYNSCPGKNVAAIELSKITATLIRDFEFRLVDSKEEWKYHQLFVTSQHGWPVYLKRRR